MGFGCVAAVVPVFMAKVDAATKTTKAEGKSPELAITPALVVAKPMVSFIISAVR